MDGTCQREKKIIVSMNKILLMLSRMCFCVWVGLWSSVAALDVQLCQLEHREGARFCKRFCLPWCVLVLVIPVKGSVFFLCVYVFVCARVSGCKHVEAKGGHLVSSLAPNIVTVFWYKVSSWICISLTDWTSWPASTWDHSVSSSQSWDLGCMLPHIFTWHLKNLRSLSFHCKHPNHWTLS